MEIGIVFALLSAVFFGASDIFLRRGVLKAGEPYTAVLISLFTGVLLFLLVIAFTAQWGKVWSLSWQVGGLLVGAGIIHFIMGRFMYYDSIRLIGANRASPISKIDVLTSVVLGIIILSESLTISLALGVLCIIPGVILASSERQGAGTEGRSETYQMQLRGVLSGLGAGLSWGSSGILIKPAVREIGSPLVGAFISYVAATLITVSLLFRKRQQEQLVRLNRSSLIPLVIAGVLSSAGQLLRFFGLSYSPVSLVQPLISTQVLYVLIFSFLLNRNIEVFTWKVIMGMVLVVAGAFLLSY